MRVTTVFQHFVVIKALIFGLEQDPVKAQIQKREHQTRFLQNNYEETTEQKQATGKIVGGIISPTAYPYFASVISGEGSCGGSLIAPDIVLSAAHCGGDTLFVRVGSKEFSSGGSSYRVVQTKLHENYIASQKLNDIMLIKFDGNASGPYVELNPDYFTPVDGAELTGMGFGLTQENGIESEILREVDFFAVNYTICSQNTSYLINDDIMVCNGYPGGGRDTCQGDSGGPVFLKGTAVQIGIVSFGDGCARPDTSSVNVRVSAFTSWIQDNVCRLSAYKRPYCSQIPTTSPAATLEPTQGLAQNFNSTGTPVQPTPSIPPIGNIPVPVPSPVPVPVPALAPVPVPITINTPNFNPNIKPNNSKPNNKPHDTSNIKVSLMLDNTKVLSVKGYASVSPKSFGDSYSVGNRCYCVHPDSNTIGEMVVRTPLGKMTIREVCRLIGPGPGMKGRPVYNDIQCGNGPADKFSGHEELCPGRVDHGSKGCGYIGPKWNFSKK